MLLFVFHVVRELQEKEGRVVLRCCLTNVILPPPPLSSIPVKLETFPKFAEWLADNPPVLRLETLAVFSHDISNSLAVPVVAAR